MAAAKSLLLVSENETGMPLYQAILVLATLLCSLVAGLLFTFAVVVMPGIGTLNDGIFIRAFQVMDRVIQNNQPLFMLVWVGSAVVLLTATLMGVWQLRGADRILLMAAAFVYFLGVQAPTFTINVPLNNSLQKLDAGTMSETAQKRARSDFEPRWNRWNAIRTACSIFASALLLILLLRVGRHGV